MQKSGTRETIFADMVENYASAKTDNIDRHGRKLLVPKNYSGEACTSTHRNTNRKIITLATSSI